MSSFKFTVPKAKRIRLIVDTDAKNEADDQYAVAHALMTPKFIVKGLIGAHFGERRTATSMEESVAEVRKVAALMGLDEQVLVARGAAREIAKLDDADTSEGSRLIVSEALKDEELPLFGIFLGPLTDMALALRQCPDIASRMTVVWIGGEAWPEGGAEFNLMNDSVAADEVFSSDVELWQIPRPVYNRFKVSLAELKLRVSPHGRIGAYLFEQTAAFNELMADNRGWPLGETWVLGDSAAVGVLLDPHEYDFTMQKRPRIDKHGRYLHQTGAEKKMRVYHNLDVRFILEDFFAKLRLCYGV